jgi:hypothetical protein
MEAEIQMLMKKNHMADRPKMGMTIDRLLRQRNSIGDRILLQAFDYNTVDSTLLSICVLINLGGVMLASERFVGAKMNLNRNEYTALTFAEVFLILGGLIYFAAAFIFDLMIVLCPNSARALIGAYSRPKSARKSLTGVERKDFIKSRTAIASAGIGGGPSEAASSGMSVNPFLAARLSKQSSLQRLTAGRAEEDDDMTSTVKAVMDLELPPDTEQWQAVKKVFANLQDNVSQLQGVLKSQNKAAATAMESGLAPEEAEDAKTGMGALRTVTRSEFTPVLHSSSKAGPARVGSMRNMRLGGSTTTSPAAIAGEPSAEIARLRRAARQFPQVRGGLGDLSSYSNRRLLSDVGGVGSRRNLRAGSVEIDVGGGDDGGEITEGRVMNPLRAADDADASDVTGTGAAGGGRIYVGSAGAGAGAGRPRPAFGSVGSGGEAAASASDATSGRIYISNPASGAGARPLPAFAAVESDSGSKDTSGSEGTGSSRILVNPLPHMREPAAAAPSTNDPTEGAGRGAAIRAVAHSRSSFVSVGSDRSAGSAGDGATGRQWVNPLTTAGAGASASAAPPPTTHAASAVLPAELGDGDDGAYFVSPLHRSH